MSGNRTILIVIAIILVAILAVLVVGRQHRSPGDKIGDGLHDIGSGIGDAAHNATH